jgi:type I restriction enzyme, R subunit
VTLGCGGVLHPAETLDQWLTQELQHPGFTVRARLGSLPTLITDGLRPAQITAIRNLGKSLAQGRPRALIQMASGGGKTYTTCNFVYRLIKHAGARRVLFLVDRSNLGRQTLKEFQQFRTPEEHRAFTELYNVQHMQSNKLNDVARVANYGVPTPVSQSRNDKECRKSWGIAWVETLIGLLHLTKRSLS